MCGRYVSPDDAAIEREFSIVRPAWPPFEMDYNVTLTSRLEPQIAVVRTIEGERTGVMMRWPLIPAWCRGKPPTFATFNTNAETMESLKTWAPIWQKGNRCVIPAVGFYEWQWNGLSGKESRTQPFFIRAADQDIYGFAGLWAKSTPEGGEPIYGCSIITTVANELMASIHNSKKRDSARVMLPRDQRRMPVILSREDREAWLTGTVDDARAAIRQYPDDLMVAHPVSGRVGSTKNNDPSLITPIDTKIDPDLPQMPLIQ